MSSAKRRLERNSPSIFTPLFSQCNLLNMLSSVAVYSLVRWCPLSSHHGHAKEKTVESFFSNTDKYTTKSCGVSWLCGISWSISLVKVKVFCKKNT